MRLAGYKAEYKFKIGSKVHCNIPLLLKVINL